MSYEITVIGGEILTVTDEQGEKLKELRLGNIPQTRPVDIDGVVLELSRIKMIKKVYDRKPEPVATLQPGKRCRGQKSIHFQIMKIIKAKYPTEWPKYFRDKEYKEKLRLWLHEKHGDDWCDTKASTCVCETGYVPETSAIQAVLSIFPGGVSSDTIPDPDAGRRDLA